MSKKIPSSKSLSLQAPESENSSTDSLTEWMTYSEGVTPLALRHKNRIHHTQPSHSPIKKQSLHPQSLRQVFNWSDTSPPSSEDKRWSRHSVGRRQWKQWLEQRPETIIDLHGHTLDSAFRELAECLYSALRHQQRVILCIHGKGLSSPTGDSVLRQALRQWLMYCPEVIAYSPAPDHRGGDGATLIWLTSPKNYSAHYNSSQHER
ncbi:MAG: Smr/MutS family protein [Pseudomonadota bacterium]